MARSRLCKRCTVVLAAGFVSVSNFSLCSAPAPVGQSSSYKNLRQVEGTTETVIVPFVSEPWLATATHVRRSEVKVPRFVGHFPGFAQAKEQANEFRRRIQRQSRSTGRSRAAEPQRLLLAGSPGVVFEGPSESDTNIIPPDPQVAAGPNDVVAVINTVMVIYDKSGNMLGEFQDLGQFFASLATVGEISDSRIIYDQADNRFILSTGQLDLANFTSAHILVAVSQTSDPTGMWNKFAIDFKGQNIDSPSESTFPDFPTLGLSSSAIYISTSQFAENATCVKSATGNCAFSDTWIKVVGLPELLSGNPALNITTFKNVTIGPRKQAFSIEPAVTYGSSDTEFLVAADYYSNPSATLNIFAINTSGQPTLSEANLGVPAFSQPPTAAQPSGTGVKQTGIATNDFRLLNAVWSNNTLWTAQNVLDTSTGAAVARWYEIAAPSLSSVSVTDSGSVSGDGDAYYPAVAVKPGSDVVMAFTTSSATQYASAALTGRSASDAPGSMRTPVVYRPGTDVYLDRLTRWGDYNGASLDPDGNEIWTIAEYAGSPNPQFGTAIAQVAQLPVLSLSTTHMDFGSETSGSPSAAQTLTVTNTSGAPVTIGTLAVAGNDPSDFAVSSDACSGVTVSPAGTCTVNLSFTSVTPGSRSATLAVTTSLENFPPSVELTGVGTSRSTIVVSPASPVSLGSTPVGIARSIPITLTSTGPDPVNIGSIVLAGTDFTETDNCVTIVPASASCGIYATFQPTAGGNRTGTITVTDDASNSPQQIQLSGMGEDFELSTSSTSSSVFPGQQAKWTLTVTPEGGLSGPVSLACAGAPELATCLMSATSVNLDGTTAVKVSITVSTTAGSRLAPGSRSRGKRRDGSNGWTAEFIVLLLPLIILGILRRRRKLVWIMGAALLLWAALATASCGGGGGGGGGGQNPGTPPGTYLLTLKATGTAQAGTGTVSVVHAATLTLTVQ